ncbi:hypothetical protein ACFSJY_07215 [Thalassotalea euphylliae]|uniref:zinc ribbon-containing protein n=1 Tax=Thalassotalea euphylliae TaxID=1655234 RepID=UPI00362DF1CA
MQEKSQLDVIYHDLSDWLEGVKKHEITELVEVVEQAKAYAAAAEALPHERVSQFISNFTYDLNDFISNWQKQSAHSVYLGVLNETFWDNVAKAADKSQVEWAELPDDLAHQGQYKSGDIIGFGLLQCKQCGYEQTISHLSTVIDCPECGCSEFQRQPLSP